jgi:hypothetical protein
VVNKYKRDVLQERLQILNFLEGLVTRSPNSSHYDEMLSNLGRSTTADHMRAHLDEVMKSGVAKFQLPVSHPSEFWALPIRITDIQLDKLQAMQQSIQEELNGMTASVACASVDLAGGEGGDEETPNSDRDSGSRSKGLAIFLGILGFMATVATIIVAVNSWGLLKTDLARSLTIIGILMLAATLTCVTLRFRTGKLSSTVLDMILAGGLCCCLTFVLTTVFSSETKPAILISSLGHGPASVTINLPPRLRIPLISNLSGDEKNLRPGELVWTFNQNIQGSGSGPYSPTTYPDSGPCTVNYVAQTWSCRGIYIGKSYDTSYYRICVAIISTEQAIVVVNTLRKADHEIFFPSPPNYVHDNSKACMSVERMN